MVPDLSEVTFMDCSGLGVLVRARAIRPTGTAGGCSCAESAGRWPGCSS
ncbi:STAS domain-containing protein [Peterkaempfera griseoplana]